MTDFNMRRKNASANLIIAVFLAACVTCSAAAGAPPEEHDIAASNPEMYRVKQVLQGYFIDPSVEQEVVYGEILAKAIPDGNSKFMQFQDGPIMEYYNISDGMVTTCQHPMTGLTYLVDVTHSGGNIDGDAGYVSFIGVNPETHEMETVYSEYAEHGPYDSKICGWPAKQDLLSIFFEAMMALRIQVDESVYLPIGKMKDGETMQLPWRGIPAQVAQTWLEKLNKLSEEIVKIERAHSDNWRIIQITGTTLCSKQAQGVVLAKHESQENWRAIYNVQAGCSKSLNYPLPWFRDAVEIISVESNMLPTDMPYEFSGWGYSRAGDILAMS